MGNKNIHSFYFSTKTYVASTIKSHLQTDGSLQNLKHMLQLIDEKILTFYAQNISLLRPVQSSHMDGDSWTDEQTEMCMPITKLKQCDNNKLKQLKSN